MPSPYRSPVWSVPLHRARLIAAQSPKRRLTTRFGELGNLGLVRRAPGGTRRGRQKDSGGSRPEGPAAADWRGREWRGQCGGQELVRGGRGQELVRSRKWQEAASGPARVRQWRRRHAPVRARVRGRRIRAREWWGQDSNLRRQSQRVYSPSPLTTRTPHRAPRRRAVGRGILVPALASACARAGRPTRGRGPREGRLRTPHAAVALLAAPAASSACDSRSGERAPW
jgi:hypothetical protein